MFAKTQNSASMILGVALVAATAFAEPAFAGALSQNESAAQNAIVGTVDHLPASVDVSPATLVHNEDLAQRVIVDVSAPFSDRVDAAGEATLAQNEIAAQRAIADAAASAGSVHYSASAKTSVVSTRSPAAH
jgi:hypothetical protein